MALNRDDMVANVFKGIGQTACTAESPASPFYDVSLLAETQGHCPPQNILKAKALLQQAGFQWNTQGQLEDAKGNRVRFELLTNSGNDQRETLGVMIAEDWKALGIQIDFRPLDFNVLIGKFDTGAWEASVMGLGGGSPLEPHDGANVWKSDGALHMFNQRPRRGDGTVNVADRLPWEVELDALFNQGAQTLELPKRRPIYRRYQHVVMEQQPFLFLVWPLSLVAVHQRLHNVYPTPLGGVLHNVESVWIEKSPQ
jgi:peptide/nickel transport system substrate-binding protein